MSKLPEIKSQNIIGCDFHRVTNKDVLLWCETALSGSDRHCITTVNVAILMMMRKSRKLNSFVKNSSLTLADGQPIIWLSKLLGRPLPQRVTGVDICQDLVKLAAQMGKSIYLLGATDEVVKQAQLRLKDGSPDLIVAGVANGYFSDKDAPKRAKAIKDSKADILIVGMGVPRQETFIQEHWDQIGAKIVLPVGGSLDVISGQKKRAPVWMQKTGLEWLFRLMQEPRRLAKRYAITNTQFIGLSLRELFR